ncbi:MAG TPA: hypothetical protein VNA11_16650 [Pseudonocardia sp.]|nr:hypothetical protein [Pseudonocardia sp.]
MAVWLALLAALSYGAGDFVGGVGGRRSEPGLIPIGIQLVGLAAALVAIGGAPGQRTGGDRAGLGGRSAAWAAGSATPRCSAGSRVAR